MDAFSGQADYDAATIDLSAGGGVSFKFKEGTTFEGLALGATLHDWTKRCARW